LFDVAVILHDSVFINAKLDLRVDKYKFLWNFPSDPEDSKYELTLLNLFNDVNLITFYNKKQWKGCFGAMTIITHDYLTHVNNKYDMTKLIDYIKDRHDRCCFERVLACLLQIDYKQQTLFGCIHDYCIWGISFHEIDKYDYLPLIKCWSGR
jgi:hypothetical protein